MLVGNENDVTQIWIFYDVMILKNTDSNFVNNARYEANKKINCCPCRVVYSKPSCVIAPDIAQYGSRFSIFARSRRPCLLLPVFEDQMCHSVT